MHVAFARAAVGVHLPVHSVYTRAACVWRVVGGVGGSGPLCARVRGGRRCRADDRRNGHLADTALRCALSVRTAAGPQRRTWVPAPLHLCLL